MSAEDQKIIAQSLLSEHHGNVAAAFADACARLSLAYRGISWAYMRRMAEPTTGAIDDVPQPIDDMWIKTGKSGD